MDQSQSAVLETRRATADFRLRARKGDYIRGRARVESGRITLDLLDRKGVSSRRLVTDGAGDNRFFFMVQEDDPLLRATAERAESAITLIIDRQVASEQQRKEETYLSPRLNALAEKLPDTTALETFWEEVKAEGTPIVEDASDGMKIVTFLARGAKRNVRILSAPSGDHEEMSRLAGTDIWYMSFSVPDTALLSYQIAPDVPDVPGNARDRRVAILATSKADPLNKHPWPADAPDAFNQESTLALENAPRAEWAEESGGAKGEIRRLSVRSEQLGNERDVYFYTPAGFDPSHPDNLLLFVFDAEKFLKAIPTPRILDNMIAEDALPPTAAVFISPIDSTTRGKELAPNANFANFVAETLLPLAEKEFGIDATPDRTIIAGSSFGGLAATSVAWSHPDSFGNVISLSGSFWWHADDAPPGRDNEVAWEIARADKKDLRYFLAAGLFEVGRRGTAAILDMNRQLRDVLVAKGYPLFYQEYAGGHDEFMWRIALADGLLALFGEE
ncbi:alpha/beta hydrolase [Notoacmeibacter ruber]|nr:alpha/beta hydrolase-fold protein [Notoacmeibacter ruber]